MDPSRCDVDSFQFKERERETVLASWCIVVLGQRICETPAHDRSTVPPVYIINTAIS